MTPDPPDAIAPAVARTSAERGGHPAPHGADDRRRFLWLLLFALLFLGAGIGLRDPWPSDEPRYALAARQMVESGDWMFPHRGVDLYPDKPPMLMWMQAATWEVVHDWRIAFLLPSLLAGLLTVALTYDLGRKLWNPRVGLFAAGTLLVVFQFVYQVKRAQIDPLVMGWITLANWGLLLHFLRGPDWRAYWLGCFAAGLGVITKGVGFLALLMLVPYAWARWRGWEVARTSHSAWRWLAGLALFLAAIAAWLVPMLLAASSRGTPAYAAYVQNILFHQTADRYADSWLHRQPAWYFLEVVLLNWFPLVLLYVPALRRWRDAIRARDARILLPLAWAAMLLVFFSIPAGKRDVYVMPVMPMVALALAPYVEAIVRARWLRITAFVLSLVFAVALLAFGVWALQGHPAVLKMAERRNMADGGLAVAWMATSIGAVYAIAVVALRPRRGAHALVACSVASWLLWSLWAYPVLNASSSAAGIMQRAGRLIGPDADLALVGWGEQHLLMADRPARDFGFRTPPAQQFALATRWQQQAPGRRWVFAVDYALGDCVRRDRAQLVGVANRHDWWVYRLDAVVSGCVPAIGADAMDDIGM